MAINIIVTRDKLLPKFNDRHNQNQKSLKQKLLPKKKSKKPLDAAYFTYLFSY